MHHSYGSSLSLGRQLRGKVQPQILHPLPLLCNRKQKLIFQTGLSIVAISITIDYLTGSFYANLLTENEEIWLYIACVSSYMLALAIGFLFVTQMMTACQNITTLESFTDGIKERVTHKCKLEPLAYWIDH